MLDLVILSLHFFICFLIFIAIWRGREDVDLRSSSTGTAEEEPGGLILIGKEDDIKRSGRVTAKANGREVVVFYHEGKFHAMDSRCYHAGGPLCLGEIEDINGQACVTCPWHKYKINLETGEGLYKARNRLEPSPTPQWESAGVKQRIHKVTIGNGNVYVSPPNLSLRFDSDYFVDKYENDGDLATEEQSNPQEAEQDVARKQNPGECTSEELLL